MGQTFHLTMSPNERAECQLDLTDLNSGDVTPTITSCTLYDSSGTDKTATNMTGSAAVTDNDTLTLPIIHTLTANAKYECSTLFNLGNNRHEAAIVVQCLTEGLV